MPNGADDIVRGLQALAKKRLLVGIPASENARTDGPIGNAALGLIHEHGSPAANIPARPFLRRGVEEAIPQMLPALRRAAEEAAKGNLAGIDQHLGAAGDTAVGSVVAGMSAGIPPPLTEQTVRGRRRRSPGSSYRRIAETPAQTTPLIDTGALRRSIAWEIR